jgi:hypothetical protein
MEQRIHGLTARFDGPAPREHSGREDSSVRPDRSRMEACGF